jgi:hypothetical protein
MYESFRFGAARGLKDSRTQGSKDAELDLRHRDRRLELAGQGRAGQGRAGQGRAGQGREEQGVGKVRLISFSQAFIDSTLLLHRKISASSHGDLDPVDVFILSSRGYIEFGQVTSDCSI